MKPVETLEVVQQKEHCKKAALTIADKVCREINNLSFDQEIKDVVKYPHQATLEFLIEILQTRV